MSLARPIIYTQRHLRAVPARTVPNRTRKELKLNLFITRIRSQPSILLLPQVAVFQLQQLLPLLLLLPPQDAPLCVAEKGATRETRQGQGTLCSLLYKFKWISIINFTNFCHSTSAQREVAVAGVAVALVVVVVAALVVVVVAHVAACKSVC